MTIRVLGVTDRMGGVSPNGCRYAVEFIVDGEPGTKTMFFDAFLARYTDNIFWSGGSP